MSRTLRRHARCLAVGVFSLDDCEFAQSAILDRPAMEALGLFREETQA